MEALYSSPDNERLINQEEREQLQRVLGSFGLYDASQDVIHSPEHPEDDKWFVLGTN